MKPVLIVYGSSYGHTAVIAEHLAGALRELGVESSVLDAAGAGPAMSLDGYSGVIAAASVKVGKHPASMVRFVKSHASELARMPNLFLSVSLTQVTAEDPKADPTRKHRAIEAVRGLIDGFVRETGWKPARALGVAGDLPYSKYNFFIRFVMKRISKSEGGPTDASRDYDFTDYAALDALAREFVHELQIAPATAHLAVT